MADQFARSIQLRRYFNFQTNSKQMGSAAGPQGRTALLVTAGLVTALEINY